MFYNVDGKWKAFTKKITYKEKKVMYDNESEIYENNPEYTYLNVEEITLSPEETERLNLVKDAKNASMDDVCKYVFESIETEKTSESIEFNKMKKKIEEMEDAIVTFL